MAFTECHVRNIYLLYANQISSLDKYNEKYLDIPSFDVFITY